MDKLELSQGIVNNGITGTLSLVVFCKKTDNPLERWGYEYGFPVKKTWCKFCNHYHDIEDLLFDFEFHQYEAQP